MPSVFLSYSHKDEVWKDRLKKHLGVAHLDVWDDRRIEGGADWFEEISGAMGEASVAVLFVSADFLTSKFVFEEEIPRLLQRRQEEGLTVFPVILRSCNWRDYNWLSKIGSRPRDGRPLASFKGDQRDAQLASIAREIRMRLQDGQNLGQLDPQIAVEPLDKATEKQLDSLVAGHGPELPAAARHPKSIKCFVTMPLIDSFEILYYDAIIPALKDVFEERCQYSRTSDRRRSGMVTDTPVYDLLGADLVIAVIADPRELNSINPNVMYELGIAHSFRRPTIVVSDNKNVPFDIQAIDSIQLDFSILNKEENSLAFLLELRSALQRSLKDPEIIDALENRHIPRNPVTVQLSGARVFVEDLPWLWGYSEVLRRERDAHTIWEITRDLFWQGELLFFESIKAGIRDHKKYYFMIPDEEHVLQKANAIKHELKMNFPEDEVDKHLHFVAISAKYFILCPLAMVLYDADSVTRRAGIILEPMTIESGNDQFEKIIRNFFVQHAVFGLEIFQEHLDNRNWFERRREASYDIRLDARAVDSLAVSFARLWNEGILEEAQRKTGRMEQSALLNTWVIGG